MIDKSRDAGTVTARSASALVAEAGARCWPLTACGHLVPPELNDTTQRSAAVADSHARMRVLVTNLYTQNTREEHHG